MAKIKKKRVAKKIKKIKPAKRRKILAKKKRVKARKKIVKKLRKKIGAGKPARRKIVRASKTIVRKIKRRTIKKPKVKQAEEFPAESLFKAKIKVIGIGGGGGSIVSEIGRSLEKASFVIADTDIRALKKKSGIKYFWFGEELTHGLGTGVNVELARQAAESAKEKISSFLKEQDIIIFIASLGGGLGSGATQVFAEAAKEFGGITFGIFTMPFKFEGKNKYRIAQNALKSLRKSLNVSLVIPNEKIFKIIDQATPITNAFSTVNKSLIESLESLIDLIYNPGIINIDFADLRTILKGRGNSAFLNTVEESGKDKVEKICQGIFKNPLLQSSGFRAGKILFNIAGGENLSMFEVEKISSHISAANPRAKIIFGISKNSKLKNKIKTTILMTDGQVREEPAKKSAEAPALNVSVEKVKSTKDVPVVLSSSAEKIEKPVSLQKVNVKRGNKVLPPVAKKSPARKTKPAKNKKTAEKKRKLPSFIPVFKVPVPAHAVSSAVSEERKIDINQVESGKKTIRRSGLEIKRAEELQEKKRIAQEKEWEIPAFLRKVKFKS